MTDEFDDVLGSLEANAAPPPRRTIRANRLDELLAGRQMFDITNMHAGVPVSWLCQVFNMDPSTAKKRLADCPVKHRRKAGYLYDVATAAQYLVKPVFDAKKFLRDMKPSELPPQLTKEFWDAELKKQKWEENAGHLWRTPQVMEVLARTFQTIKTTMQLWSEDLERSAGLTEEQRLKLVAMVDALQNDIHQNLILAMQERQTFSVKSEIETEEVMKPEYA